MMKSNKIHKKARGQSLVEVALVFPILVMLMMGLLDLGRAFYSLIALRDAADEGASYASIYPMDALQQPDQELRTRAGEATSGNLIPFDDGSKVQIDCTNAVLSTGNPITVEITYIMPIYTPFINGMTSVDGGIPLHVEVARPIVTVQ